MNNIFRIISASTIVATLAACAFDDVKILSDSKITSIMNYGMTKQKVIELWGQPKKTLPTLQGHGVCFDYDHKLANGNIVPVYVAFRNIDDRVVANGVKITCREAYEAGYLNSSELPKQRY